MIEKLLIRITSIHAPAEWTVIDAQGNRMGFPQQGELESAAPLARQRRVVVLVSGPEITTHQVSLPVKSRKQLLQALPFALEDNLSEDIERLHFAVAKANGEQARACVCRRTWLTELVERFNLAGIDPDVVTPDYLAIDPELERPVVVVDHQTVTYCAVSQQWTLPVSTFDELAASYGQAMSGEHEISSFFCSEAGAGNEDRIKNFFDYDGPGDKSGRVRNSLLPLFTAGVHAEQGINLLQGPFRPTHSRGTGPANWKTPAALAAAWLILFAGNFITERFQYSSQALELDRQIEQAFQAMLPGSRMTADPRAQIEQALGRRAGRSRSTEFLALLSVSGSAIGSEPGTSVNAVTFADGQIEVSVNAENIQALDNIKNLIIEQQGLSVELLSADTRENHVVGQFRITSGS